MTAVSHSESMCHSKVTKETVIGELRGLNVTRISDHEIMGAANSELKIVGNTEILQIGRDSVNGFMCMTSCICMRTFFSFFSITNCFPYNIF